MPMFMPPPKPAIRTTSPVESAPLVLAVSRVIEIEANSVLPWRSTLRCMVAAGRPRGAVGIAQRHPIWPGQASGARPLRPGSRRIRGGRGRSENMGRRSHARPAVHQLTSSGHRTRRNRGGDSAGARMPTKVPTATGTNVAARHPRRGGVAVALLNQGQLVQVLGGQEAPARGRRSGIVWTSDRHAADGGHTVSTAFMGSAERRFPCLRRAVRR